MRWVAVVAVVAVVAARCCFPLRCCCLPPQYVFKVGRWLKTMLIVEARLGRGARPGGGGRAGRPVGWLSKLQPSGRNEGPAVGNITTGVETVTSKPLLLTKRRFLVGVDRGFEH